MSADAQSLDAGPVAAADACVDVQFALQGGRVPHDYAYLLWQALCGSQTDLPWEDERVLGVHPLSGLSPGQDCWYLSRRSRLTLRLPQACAAQAMALSGTLLAVGGTVLEVGQAKLREIAYSPVLYSKFVAFGPPSHGALATEPAFLDACMAHLWDGRGQPQIICGRPQRAKTPDGWISGFSLLLAGLDNSRNLRLQHFGMGGERQRGCGIFVPHKTFSAVTLE